MSQDWNRIPCSRNLRTPEEARAWYTGYRARAISEGLQEDYPIEMDIRLTRPPGWGSDGRPRYGVWVRRTE